MRTRLQGTGGVVNFRRAVIASLAAHLALLIAASVLARPRFSVPEPMQSIPVSLVGAPAPRPARTQRIAPSASPSRPSIPVPKPAAPKQDKPKEGIAPKKSSTIKPSPKQAQVRPAEGGRGEKDDPDARRDLPRTGAADTTQTLRSELPAVGDLRGSMSMQIEGEPLPYSYYLGIVHDKIASFWEPSSVLEAGGNEISAVVRFRIERDGTISDSFVEEPSGTTLYDRSALRAVSLAAPLPPLPAEYGGDHLIIHLRFLYTE